MKTRIVLPAGVFAVALLAVGCGPNLTAVPPTPTGPTTLAPLLLPKLDGVWAGDLTLLDIAGGTGSARNAGAQACGGAAITAVLNESVSHSLSIKQDGMDLTARLTSAGTGLACTYKGRVGSNSSALVLDAASCDATSLTFRCPNGEVVELALVGSSITAALDAPVSVTSLSGVAAHTYNVSTAAGSNQDQGLVARQSFTNLTRR